MLPRIFTGVAVMPGRTEMPSAQPTTTLSIWSSARREEKGRRRSAMGHSLRHRAGLGRGRNDRLDLDVALGAVRGVLELHLEVVVVLGDLHRRLQVAADHAAQAQGLERRDGGRL